MPEQTLPPISRRALCAGFAVATIAPSSASAQNAPAAPARPAPTAPTAPQPASAAPDLSAQFDFGEVIEAARRLAAAPYHAPPLVQTVLEGDAYRAVRFRAERAFLADQGSKFRLHLAPTGGAGASAVAVNVVSGGVARAIAFSSDLFDFGPQIDARQRAAVNGFAGLSLLYPLNAPTTFDDVIAFLRASYFRFVGRGQIFGQSMRGLAIGAGDPSQPEEFPRFREFWAVQPAPGADSVELMALLDSPSLAGAYHMMIRPGGDTTIDVTARLFARADVARLGLAPITSMYLTGESDPRVFDDFRLEVHDACGLLALAEGGDWTWRPLRNPAASTVSQFSAPASGFGLIQRLRQPSLYHDLDADYELRPSYWVEPMTGFGKGALQLVELREQAETDDNIVAQWRPDDALAAGAAHTWTYRISTRERDPDHGLVALAAHTLVARSPANLAGAPPGASRFFVDFAGPPLSPFLDHPEDLAIVADVQGGKARATVARHPEAPKLRVTLDVSPDKGALAKASLHLAWLGRPVTEIWTFPVQG